MITIWNSTTSNVTFSISASPYQSGQYFNFTLRPGQFQSYYASFSITNNAPIFRVSFDPIHQFNAIQLSDPTVPFPPEYPDEQGRFIVTFYFNETPPGGGGSQ